MDTQCNLFVNRGAQAPLTEYVLFFKGQQFDIYQGDLDHLAGMLMKHMSQDKLQQSYDWAKKCE